MTRLADALQDCLEAVATGRAKADECPARYPDLAAELAPLLLVYQQLRADASVRCRHVQPHPAKTAPTDGSPSPATPPSPTASTSEE